MVRVIMDTKVILVTSSKGPTSGTTSKISIPLMGVSKSLEEKSLEERENILPNKSPIIFVCLMCKPNISFINSNLVMSTKQSLCRPNLIIDISLNIGWRKISKTFGQPKKPKNINRHFWKPSFKPINENLFKNLLIEN